MKIVLVSHSGIGNLIHLTPLAQALHEYVGEKPTILTWSRSCKILEGWEHASVLPIDPVWYFQQQEATHIYLQPAGAWWDQVPLLKEKKLPGLQSATVFRQSPGKNWEKHEAEYAMDFARWLGYQGETPPPSVSIPDKSRCFADFQLEMRGIKPGEPFVCINAAYLKDEHWPMKHAGDEVYKRLIGNLNLRCVFVGAPADDREANEIIRSFNFWVEGREPVNLCGFSADIRDTAAIINRATLTIGNDGGLQHVSAAVGTPTLTVFTFTNPVKNRPLGDERFDRVLEFLCFAHF